MESFSKKEFLHLTMPVEDEAVGDRERIEQALRERAAVLELPAVRELPAEQVLREQQGQQKPSHPAD